MAQSFYKTLLALSKTYDDIIDFELYYSRMFPSRKLVPGPVPCEIHREKRGASFSYRKSDGICSCFGECKFSGRTTLFHLKYMKTLTASFGLLEALRTLHTMFPTTPDPDMYIKENAHSFQSQSSTLQNYDFKTMHARVLPSKTYTTIDEKYLALLLCPKREEFERSNN